MTDPPHTPLGRYSKTAGSTTDIHSIPDILVFACTAGFRWYRIPLLQHVRPAMRSAVPKLFSVNNFGRICELQHRYWNRMQFAKCCNTFQSEVRVLYDIVPINYISSPCCDDHLTGTQTGRGKCPRSVWEELFGVICPDPHATVKSLRAAVLVLRHRG